jgi:predicted outer membrane repeat protein
MSRSVKRLGVVGVGVSLLAASGLVSGCTSNRDESVAEVGTCQAQNATSDGAASADLQAVIDAAAPKDVIEVSGHCTGTFVVENDLIVRRALDADRAVLDGGGAGSVLTITGAETDHATVRLDHLKITAGSADNGGGIHADQADVQLVASAVVHNHATQGAGVFSVGSLVLSKTRISGNGAARDGGGVFIDGLLRLTAGPPSSVSGNRAVNGGGVFSLGEGVILRGASQIARNVSGGIYADNGRGKCQTVIMYGSSSVWGNRQGPKPASDGGGIAGCKRVVMNGRSTVHHNLGLSGGIWGRTVVMNDHATISDNVALSYGGGIGASLNGLVVMRHRSKIVRNEALGRYSTGGGISVSEHGIVRMSGHSKVATNVSKRGGGIEAQYSDVVLRGRATVTDNTATQQGGGVHSLQICTDRHYKVQTFARSTISHNVPDDVVIQWDPNGCG